MDDLQVFADEIHLLMSTRGHVVFPARSQRLAHFVYLADLTVAYIRSTVGGNRCAAAEKKLAEEWEVTLLDAAVCNPRFSLICGDIVDFWRDPDAHIRKESFSVTALAFLAAKLTRFGS